MCVCAVVFPVAFDPSFNKLYYMRISTPKRIRDLIINVKEANSIRFWMHAAHGTWHTTPLYIPMAIHKTNILKCHTLVWTSLQFFPSSFFLSFFFLFLSFLIRLLFSHKSSKWIGKIISSYHKNNMCFSHTWCQAYTQMASPCK